MDADVKAKQAQAKRAELLFKLKQSELKAAGSTQDPLGGQASAVYAPLLSEQFCAIHLQALSSQGWSCVQCEQYSSSIASFAVSCVLLACSICVSEVL